MGLLDETSKMVAPLSADAMQRARERILDLTMPPWALGRICDLAVLLSGITDRLPPPVERRVIVTMAGDHGIVEEGVSLHGAEVTRQMVANIAAGGAGVNVLARVNATQVVTADLGMRNPDPELCASGAVLDLSVGRGTANFARGPAMDRDTAVLAVERGIALARELASEVDVFGTGEMGIGNTSPATAIGACLTGLPVELLCGPGTGLSRVEVARKAEIIEQGLGINRPNPEDGLDVLAKVGGFEIAGIAGLVLGAAACRKPVLIDGFVATAGAMIARSLCPEASSYMILSHASAEPGHIIMCEWLRQTPLLQLDMRLGEGTGAALAMNLLAASAAIVKDMATFDSAGVDAKPC